ncbi:hypothetical protein GCM10007920_00060 [Ciceribacter naphthalenivorans]|uniref:O-GlcNAc transferase C-terminal domain-containing protein n=3 Tax=Pseudomonadota TaxID=1224 RepID=A0A512HD58_9HYPH|nr:hypothetical protein RNA01_03160 [Ciceribacter naphthalenivorans]GLR20222.1 hypothetical protein GCM10007920_00060 [Ciceribacter naphthalenivorans]GLT03078.1 hypothetical protein GCM10007926_00060 [Sphingomonas psychrolutea]
MPKGLPDAINAYKAGRYQQCLARLLPLLGKASADAKLVLMAAQCHVKLGNSEKAADFYARAANLDSANARMLRLLAARSYRLARRRAPALMLARQAARGGPFDLEAEHTYRGLLRELLCLEECEAEDMRMLERMKSGEAAAFAVDDPHDHIMWCDDESLNARITRMPGGTAFTPQSRVARRTMPHRFADKIRIGYLSNDVCDQHATMRLLQGVLMAHDREKFDITVFCYTDDGVLSVDQGMRQHYGTIVPIRTLDDEQAAEAIREHGIDILVDLKGHTKDARINLVNRGLAPIQVAYLGFPGCGTGIDCDYVIGDGIVTPDTSKPYYHEKLCRLPDCYQANDREHRALPPAASREGLGLPQDAFVIASFNAVRKISARTARLWARILVAIPDAILWMMCDDVDAQANFSAYMAGQGVATDRIHYARRADYPAHVARLQAADIAVDTFPTNGHTTTSDKLWAGLPVLTCKGHNFTSRVSESLLNAVGMAELVAEDEDGVVELGIALARDRDRLADIRARLAANRLVEPLFDTERFTRHLERAYEMMVEREKQGLEPDHIDVPRLEAPWTSTPA